MISIKNTAKLAFAKIVSVLYLVSSSLGAVGATTPAEPAEEVFTPVIRFAVCSDVHVEIYPNASTERLGKLIQFMYSYSESQSDYKGFDALCIAGDFTNTGIDTQYDTFLQVINENLRPETQLIACMGNHEFKNTRDYDPSLSADLYVEKMGTETNTVYEINGYQFVSCSYDSFTASSYILNSGWLERSVRTAVEKSGDKPVFVIQHAAPFDTVYGSLNWGDPVITGVLANYPTVIDFSGHSHYPINDPRSIWQGSFTALGCGTLYRTETALDGFWEDSPYDSYKTASFYIVEANAEGDVRVKAYDLITDSFFDLEYMLTGLADRNYEYTYEKRCASDPAPAFPEGTQISASQNENGETIISFDGAEDKYVVESYKLSVNQNGISKYSESIYSKYMYLYEPNHYDINVGVLEAGSYTVEVVAVNAYTKTSAPLRLSFTVN